jgi:hypothetical protein
MIIATVGDNLYSRMASNTVAERHSFRRAGTTVVDH